MPMTSDEAKRTIHVCLKYVDLLTLHNIAQDLYREVGSTSTNKSVEETLRSLATGTRELMIEEAVRLFEQSRNSPTLLQRAITFLRCIKDVVYNRCYQLTTCQTERKSDECR